MNILSYNKKTTWIDIEKPSKSDVEYLKQNFNFHSTVLNELIPETIRTKVDTYNDYFYIVLHFPWFNKESQKIYPQELDILISKTHIITSHKNTLVPMKSIFDKCNIYEEEKQKYLADGPAKLLYFILNEQLIHCATQLDDISEYIDRAEEAIFSGKEHEMIKEISIIKRNLLDFRRALKPQRQILESLHSTINKFFGEEFSPFYNKIMGLHLRIWDLLDSFKETVESLETTNSTLFHSRLNETMKILTVFTAMLLPASIIFSLFGMNIRHPLENISGGFMIIILIAVTFMTFVFIFFRRKKIL